MLQNRVTPFGHLIQTPARGSWTGTRGLIHNDKQVIVSDFKHKAWITCKLEFKGRKRAVMSPGLCTELFSLDEATAFAAGHRPCCECRREDFNRFKSAWLVGNHQYGFNQKTSIREIDNIIHQERINNGGSKVTFEENADLIPDGAFISHNNEPYLFSGKQMFLWSPSGYGEGTTLPTSGQLTVLTPRSILNALRAYQLTDSMTMRIKSEIE